MSRIVGVLCCAIVIVWGLMLARPVSSQQREIGEDPFGYSSPASPKEAKLTERSEHRPDIDIEDRIDQVLYAPLKSALEFQELPLNEIMQIIEEEYDIPIVIDEAALDAMVVSPEVEMTVDLRNISLRSALNLMLRQPGLEDLTYLVHDQVLQITSKERAEETLVTVVYRVDDLISNTSFNAHGEDFDSLIDLIISIVDPEVWMENGTGHGEIQPLPPGVLVVSQTRKVQKKIATLLRDLRQTRAQVMAGQAHQESADRLISRSFTISNKKLETTLEDDQSRDLIARCLRGSVEWEPAEGIDQDDVWLEVLPDLVLVRHQALVVSQVEKVMMDMRLGGFGGGIGCSPVSYGGADSGDVE